MSRRPRADTPGSWHHVLNRAIAKRPYFEARSDKRYFLARLAAEVEQWRGWLASDERTADARQRLQHALEDSDFSSVRGDGLDTLPLADRAAWNTLWVSIEVAVEEGGR